MKMKRQSLYLVNHIDWVSSFLFIIYSLFQHYWTIRKNTISSYWLFYNWLKTHNFSVLPMLTSGCFLNSQKNWAESTESPHTCTVPPPTINIPHHNSTFVTNKGFTLTHHYHPKSIDNQLGIVRSMDDMYLSLYMSYRVCPLP